MIDFEFTVYIFKIVLVYCRVLILLLIPSYSADLGCIWSSLQIILFCKKINTPTTTAAIADFSLHNAMGPVFELSLSEGEGKIQDISKA